jgi:hypothetical protein
MQRGWVADRRNAPERDAILARIAEFRERYQLLFQRGVGGSGA